MVHSHLLGTELTRHVHLRSQILNNVPSIDDDTLRDTLEGITSLPEMVAEVVRCALVDEAMAAGLRDRLGEMKARLERLEHRARSKRSIASEVMVEADIKKLVEPDFTASLRPLQPGLVVVAEDEIPSTYWKPQPDKLDRQAVLSVLKSGEAVPGAALSNPRTTLSVRSK